MEFFRNMGLENTSDNYDIMWVAPLQIKPMILAGIDAQIARAQAGEPGAIFKTNSITDKDVIEKLVEASQAGVPVTLFVRGVSYIMQLEAASRRTCAWCPSWAASWSTAASTGSARARR